MPLPVVNPVASLVLLTLCSVGLSLYLQSRFLCTFYNQIIYVIKKYTKKYFKYIYIYLYVVGFRMSLNGQVENFCMLDFLVVFLEE